jgi:hypothetical protein
LSNASEAELAYCAGLWDGEGCFYIGKAEARSKRGRASPYYGLVASLMMTRREAMLKVEELFGGESKWRKRLPPNRDVWEWKCYGDDAKMLAKALLPYLQIKKEAALLAIQFRNHMEPFRWRGPIQLPPHELILREDFRQRMIALNERGA